MRSARQVSAPTSDPAPGSDIETASTRPLVTPPSTTRFCSSVPNFSYAAAAMTVVAKPLIGARP
ncbi:hypothetical protein AMK26_19475 [Streptomyces sp. CB03234]|nr:hypothetical protein AMK26_19475 [Streptomyces sp. CB03234]